MVEDSRNPSKALICITCGDTGFKELLLRCDKCQITAEHQYCAAETSISNEDEFTYTCQNCLLVSAKKLKRPITDLKANSLLAEDETNSQTSISDPVEADAETHDAPLSSHPSDDCDLKENSLLAEEETNVQISVSDPVEENVVPLAHVDPVEADVGRRDVPLSLQSSNDYDLKKKILPSEVETDVQISMLNSVEADVETRDAPLHLQPSIDDLELKRKERKLLIDDKCEESNDKDQGLQVDLVETDVQRHGVPLPLQPSDDCVGNSKDCQDLKRKRRRLIDKKCDQSIDKSKGLQVVPVASGAPSKNPPSHPVKQTSNTVFSQPSISDSVEPNVVVPLAQLNPVEADVETRDAPLSLQPSDDCDVDRKRRKLIDDQSARGAPSKLLPPYSSKDTPEYVYAQPIIDPAWRGSFTNPKENLNGVVAHLSSKACYKVVEAAKLMPPILSVEMTPRTDIWPESFNLSPPTDEHIAIYFFPESGKSGVKTFDEVVKYVINGDLGLKVLFENIELRIFASNQLPPPYWRFKGKYYLWGVYRGRKHERSDSVESMQMSPLSVGSDSPCSPLPQSKRMFSPRVS